MKALYKEKVTLALVFALCLILIVLIHLIKLSEIEIIAWDDYIENDSALLFTIEGKNEIVYSNVLKKEIQTGKVLKIYKVDKTDFVKWQKENKQINHHTVATFILNKARCIYQNDMAVAKPWLITVGRMKEQSAIDIFIGAYRATDYYDAETRPYFLQYDNGNVYRKWTGSYLVDQAFSEAEFMPYSLDDYDVLVVKGVTYYDKKAIITDRYYRLEGFSPYELKKRD